MADLREVFEMVKQQTEPDTDLMGGTGATAAAIRPEPGRLGALAVVAALVAAATIRSDRPPLEGPRERRNATTALWAVRHRSHHGSGNAAARQPP